MSRLRDLLLYEIDVRLVRLLLHTDARRTL